MFIARISRGRTIKQLVVGVLLVVSSVSLVWFAIFGGSAISAQRTDVDLAASSGVKGQMFGLLHSLPLGTVFIVLAMILIATFFVSGADVAPLVYGTHSPTWHHRATRWVVVAWGVVMGATAAIMLAVGSSQDEALTGIQNITTVMSAPSALVMLGLCIALTKDLYDDPVMRRDRRAGAAVEQAIYYGARNYGDDFVVAVRHHADAPGDATPTRTSGTCPSALIAGTAVFSPSSGGGGCVRCREGVSESVKGDWIACRWPRGGIRGGVLTGVVAEDVIAGRHEDPAPIRRVGETAVDLVPKSTRRARDRRGRDEAHDDR